MDRWAVELAVATVFCGCQINVSSLETIVSDPSGKGFGFTLTFLQFLFVAAAALPESVRWRQWRRSGRLLPPLAPRQLRLDLLAALAAVFWLVSVINNVVFIFNISVPIHTVFRSSSLVANVATGFVFFGKRYTAQQLLCVALVTAGVLILALSVAPTSSTRSNDAGGAVAATEADAAADFALWATGIAALFASVVFSACLGLIQDYTYDEARRAKRGGPDAVVRWKEAMLYSHMMTLPLFLLAGWKQIVDDIGQLPTSLYPYVLVNVLSQFLCIRGVYALIDTTSAFSMTMTITMRKFASLLISVFYFGHYRMFTAIHWAAIAMVMVGGPLFPFAKKAQQVQVKRE